MTEKFTGDAKYAVQLAFEGVGGVKGLIKWIKASAHNRGVFYSQLYRQLIPMALAGNVDVKIEHDDSLAKLHTHFANIIRSQKEHEDARARAAGITIEEGETYQDALERIVTGGSIIEHLPQPEPDIQRAVERDTCVVIDEPKATGQKPQVRAAAEAKPPHVVTIDNEPTPAEAKRRAMEPSCPQPTQSTTAAYFEWAASQRPWWGPVGSGGGPP
jgi:hypothetical protein